MMVVSDTTPISNLLNLDLISILGELFGTVYIPGAVADEINASFSSSQSWRQSLDQERIVIVPISNTVLVKQMVPMLHRGEAETICLALEKKAKLCLIDDKDGRLIAQSNNLPLTGTLGLLLKSRQSGLIPSVKPLLDALRIHHHFWVSQEMYEKALHMAGEGIETRDRRQDCSEARKNDYGGARKRQIGANKNSQD
jgi:uncharacterized protein